MSSNSKVDTKDIAQVLRSNEDPKCPWYQLRAGMAYFLEGAYEESVVQFRGALRESEYELSPQLAQLAKKYIDIALSKKSISRANVLPGNNE